MRDGVVADSEVEGMHGKGLNAVGLGNGDLRKAAARFFAAAQLLYERMGVQGEDVDLRAY